MMIMDNEISVKEVIVSHIATRGKGDKYSPIRRIVQVFEKDGTLIAENDPCPETFAIFDIVNFARHKGLTVGVSDVHAWLDTIKKD